MSCNWRARFELRAECGVNPPGEELSAGREGGADYTKVIETIDLRLTSKPCGQPSRSPRQSVRCFHRA